jgi:hypothetical protein
MVWTVRLCWLLKVSTDKTDLLDFADRIGPGGKGLKRDREDDDSENDDLDLDLDMSEEETDDDDDQEDEDAGSTVDDIDPDDLLDDEPSDLDEADIESKEQRSISAKTRLPRSRMMQMMQMMQMKRKLPHLRNTFLRICELLN